MTFLRPLYCEMRDEEPDAGCRKPDAKRQGKMGQGLGQDEQDGQDGARVTEGRIAEPLTPALSPSDGARVTKGRARGIL